MPCFIGTGRPKENTAVPKQKDIDIQEVVVMDSFNNEDISG